MLINDKKSFVLHAVLDKLSYPIQDSLTLILLLYGFWNKILDVYLDQFESRYPRPSEFEKRTNLVSQGLIDEWEESPELLMWNQDGL